MIKFGVYWRHKIKTWLQIEVRVNEEIDKGKKESWESKSQKQ